MVVFITGGLPEFAGWVTIGPKTYAPGSHTIPSFTVSPRSKSRRNRRLNPLTTKPSGTATTSPRPCCSRPSRQNIEQLSQHLRSGEMNEDARASAMPNVGIRRGLA